MRTNVKGRLDNQPLADVERDKTVLEDEETELPGWYCITEVLISFV